MKKRVFVPDLILSNQNWTNLESLENFDEVVQHLTFRDTHSHLFGHPWLLYQYMPVALKRVSMALGEFRKCAISITYYPMIQTSACVMGSLIAGFSNHCSLCCNSMYWKHVHHPLWVMARNFKDACADRIGKWLLSMDQNSSDKGDSSLSC